MEDDLPIADPRHMDLENRIGASLSTESMQTLIVGRDITGVSAFA
jgi:hypothetical protein